jgi:hypothetical protein
MTRRFAEDTRVPVATSQAQVKAMLQKAGATRTAVFEEPLNSSVAFQIGDGMYRITVPVDPSAKSAAQDEKRAWRLMGLLIKAKLEAVKEGASTIEREFLADMLLYNGRTVAETAMPEIERARVEGRMPKSLMLEGPR